MTVRHKPGKKHIVRDAFCRLASINSNVPDHDPEYAKLDVVFAYSATLAELRTIMLSKIVRGYRQDTWWRKIFSQVEENESLGINKAVLPFEKGEPAATTSDQYFQLRPKQFQGKDLNLRPEPSNRLEPYEIVSGEDADNPDSALAKFNLLFNVNRLTGVQHLCISLVVVLDVIQIAYGQGYPGFFRCFEILTRSCYIRGLI